VTVPRLPSHIAQHTDCASSGLPPYRNVIITTIIADKAATSREISENAVDGAQHTQYHTPDVFLRGVWSWPGPAQCKRTKPRQDRKVAAVGVVFMCRGVAWSTSSPKSSYGKWQMSAVRVGDYS